MTRRLIRQLLVLPRIWKRLIVVSTDLLLVLAAQIMAGLLVAFPVARVESASMVLFGLLTATAALIGHGLYRSIFRVAEWRLVAEVARAASVFGLLWLLALWLLDPSVDPRGWVFLTVVLVFLGVLGVRLAAGRLLGGPYVNFLRKVKAPRTLIYGAGAAGRQLIDDLADRSDARVVGLLDDSPRLQGQTVQGHQVFDPADLSALVPLLQVEQVFLAIPSLSRRRRNEILETLRPVRVSVRSLPVKDQLPGRQVGASDIQELDVEDLLGREPVAPHPDLLTHRVSGKVVMVTGAGGSIGSELCRQILRLRPQTLLLLERHEYALYALHASLQQASVEMTAPPRIVPFLASVLDADRMAAILKSWRPETVYHAAAYKHVPLVELNPSEGILNNVLGTLTTVRAAEEAGVLDFVLVSTDKAVRPTNVMGATKRLAEMILQARASSGSKTRFCMVRFGNVLGSSGSVVPKFREQIRQGGPVTVTHPEVTRYFMTLPEAAQLVIQASALAHGGDVFLLDMGKPVKILEFARKMIELSGQSVREPSNPAGDVAIEIIGLRPGEKLYEELLVDGSAEPTQHPRISRARDECVLWQELEPQLQRLLSACTAADANALRERLMGLVRGYQPASQPPADLLGNTRAEVTEL